MSYYEVPQPTLNRPKLVTILGSIEKTVQKLDWRVTKRLKRCDSRFVENNTVTMATSTLSKTPFMRSYSIESSTYTLSYI